MNKPKYTIGDKICGSLFAGIIQNAFYFEDQWNYNIGENADTSGELRMGQKFIKENDVKWIVNYTGQWIGIEYQTQTKRKRKPLQTVPKLVVYYKNYAKQ